MKRMGIPGAAALVVPLALALVGSAAPPVSAAAPEPLPAEFTPGERYFGSEGYVEYLAGNLPVIFAAPHGGHLRPSTIPERTEQRCGVTPTTVNDLNTQELAREIQREFFAETGKYPHVVINRLHRTRLDANRAIDEAACGSARAERAWTDFHAFIGAAGDQVRQDYDKGWFTDLHGHGHDVQRLELGYLLTGEQLRRPDAELDAGSFETGTSIRSFSEESPRSFSGLLRGPTALGTLFADAGYPATPSEPDPAPAASEPFFSGGYNTRRHGCVDGGPICGVQIEHNRLGVRENDQQVADYAEALYEVYDTYLRTNFGILVQSSERGVDTLRSAVDGLVRAGALARGHGTGLGATLDTAQAQLARNRPSAERTLAAFRTQVEALIRSGALESGPGEQVSTLAKRVLQTMRA
ncbi:hypothetical protein [Saccharopolyspora sp. CA-218241]|uniref:hypothetical protein n=1 Tax=Saccharopolyspora sp. CA-218241 TaxID=3240027 RepID=UPI003D95E686